MINLEVDKLYILEDPNLGTYFFKITGKKGYFSDNYEVRDTVCIRSTTDLGFIEDKFYKSSSYMSLSSETTKNRVRLPTQKEEVYYNACILIQGVINPKNMLYGDGGDENK